MPPLTALSEVLAEKSAEKSISSVDELSELYNKLKYRVLNKNTNRPYFNTNFDTFKNWHLLSPEQIKKHRIGICYDTAAMTDAVLNDLGIEHENYFMHTDSPSWENDPTHTFNVYKDEDGNWRWLEGSWGPYKDNKLKKKSAKEIVREIVKLHQKYSGKDNIKLHKVDKFPEPGIGMEDFYDEMLKKPVKNT